MTAKNADQNTFIIKIKTYITTVEIFEFASNPNPIRIRIRIYKPNSTPPLSFYFESCSNSVRFRFVGLLTLLYL